MERQRSKSPIYTIFLLVWVPVILACNLVSRPVIDSSDPSSLELRQTMAAMQPYTPASPLEPAEEPGGEPSGEIPISGQASAPTPTVGAAPSPWPTVPANPGPVFVYVTRSGDTLEALARRFGVEPGEVNADQPLPASGYLPQGVEARIPNTLDALTPGTALLPDSEIVNSPAAAGFNVADFAFQAGGFLPSYREEVYQQILDGPTIIQLVADELSINPRLLLAVLEYRSGWVYGQPKDPSDLSQPVGFNIADRKGLYQEIMIVATQLNVAYYGWRQGTFTTLTYADGSKVRLNPALNPGSVATQHLLAMFYRPQYWVDAVYGENGFLLHFARMFGDPWARAVDPLLPTGLVQPVLSLPFTTEYRWALTAGPHNSWNAGTPRGALDLSPITGQAKCQVSRAWATAPASALVVRSGYNAVVLDLEEDGYEQTGWALLFYHIADHERILAPTRVNLDDPLGHPSCEGGRATGTHIHLARKFNGEWLPADGPVPFILDGWRAIAGQLNYQGSLVRGEQIVEAKPGGERGSTIIRESP
jgi:LasA protease